MLAPTRPAACESCGRERRPEDTHCPLCGHLFVVRESAVAATAALREAALPASPALPRAPVAANEPPRILGLPEPWFYLLAGLAPAPLLLLSWRTALVGWYFGSLVHELGHTAAGWLLGMPSFPVLSFSAQAMSPHGEQELVLFLLVFVALAWGAWRIRIPAVKWTALGLLAVVHPVLAFTDVQELFLLSAGHLAELAFASLCFWRALTGGFTSSNAERWLYSAVGWYLVAVNTWLTGGLVVSEAHRSWYRSNGSFGLENDYVRIAQELRGWDLEHVGLVMTIPALLVVPLAIALWQLTRPVDAD